MSLFQIHKRLIQLGTLTGVAPYHLKNNIFESSTRAIYTLIVIGFLNIIIIYRMISSIITRKNEDDKPFGYTFFLDAISVFTYSSVCFVLAGILFYRVNLISHMNRLLRHPIIQKTYDHEKRTIHHFFLITYGSLILMGVTILSGTTMDRNFQNILDLILSVPLMVLCVMTMVQFLVAIQIIYLSYGRIHFELRTGKLTVEKLRQISFLDIWLKDFAGVVEYAYGPFICVYIFLSFLYMLTIELYIAEGGLMFIKTIYAYFTVMPSIMLFVWFIWKCSLITREVNFCFFYLNRYQF